MCPVDHQDFEVLWPSILLHQTLPGHQHANRELERLILAQEHRHDDLTTDYLSENFFSDDNPAVAWLKQCILRSTLDYCERAGIKDNVPWVIQGWANVNRLGDYHDPHNHPYAYLSGTYYVRVPQERSTHHNRADVRPGCITFYDPRGTVNMTAIRNDPQIDPEFTMTPTPGMILLWPAFLMHFVHPNLSDEPRISISFNLIIKNPTEFLPAQR